MGRGIGAWLYDSAFVRLPCIGEQQSADPSAARKLHVDGLIKPAFVARSAQQDCEFASKFHLYG